MAAGVERPVGAPTRTAHPSPTGVSGVHVAGRWVAASRLRPYCTSASSSRSAWIRSTAAASSSTSTRPPSRVPPGPQVRSDGLPAFALLNWRLAGPPGSSKCSRQLRSSRTWSARDAGRPEIPASRLLRARSSCARRPERSDCRLTARRTGSCDVPRGVLPGGRATRLQSGKLALEPFGGEWPARGRPTTTS